MLFRRGWNEKAGFVTGCKNPRTEPFRGHAVLARRNANWWCRRHAHDGHLFQGRFKGERVEDETYFWTVSRYIHLNPVRAGLVEHPADWPWSCYPGYARRRRRVAWISHDTLLSAWQVEFGGSDAARAYRGFVEQGIENPPAFPFQHALHGWIRGSRKFADCPRSRRLNRDEEPENPHDRQLRRLDVSLVWAAVANHDGIDPEVLGQRSRNPEIIRSVAAWLAKRHTATTLRELASWLGLGRAQNASSLTRRVDESLTKSKALRRTIQEIQTQLADWQQEKPKPRPGKKKN